MKPPNEPPPGKDESSPKSLNLDGARRVIEEYAADLRASLCNLWPRRNKTSVPESELRFSIYVWRYVALALRTGAG